MRHSPWFDMTINTTNNPQGRSPKKIENIAQIYTNRKSNKEEERDANNLAFMCNKHL